MGVNIAVLCSGNGSNFQAIVDASKKKLFDAEIKLMVCDNKSAFALKRAKKESIPTLLVVRKNFNSTADFEDKIINQLENDNIDLICMAGFMRILSPKFVGKFKNRILNVHPTLLPSFKGAHGIKDAFDYGVKATGVSVHFVTEEMDFGPIILQEPARVEGDDTIQTLERKIHAIEHILYPEAIRLFTEGRLQVRGRKVKLKK